jgi:hypothetical protein
MPADESWSREIRRTKGRHAGGPRGSGPRITSLFRGIALIDREARCIGLAPLRMPRGRAAKSAVATLVFRSHAFLLIGVASAHFGLCGRAARCRLVGPTPKSDKVRLKEWRPEDLVQLSRIKSDLPELDPNHLPEAGQPQRPSYVRRCHAPSHRARGMTENLIARSEFGRRWLPASA